MICQHPTNQGPTIQQRMSDCGKRKKLYKSYTYGKRRAHFSLRHSCTWSTLLIARSPSAATRGTGVWLEILSTMGSRRQSCPTRKKNAPRHAAEKSANSTMAGNAPEQYCWRCLSQRPRQAMRQPFRPQWLAMPRNKAPLMRFGYQGVSPPFYKIIWSISGQRGQGAANQPQQLQKWGRAANQTHQPNQCSKQGRRRASASVWLGLLAPHLWRSSA